MKRLLLICGLALAFVPSALAGGTRASIVPNGQAILGQPLDFTVTIDRGSAASVYVQCLVGDLVVFSASPLALQSDGTYGSRFAASPGVPIVSPSLIVGASSGASCTAYLYDWVRKPNGSWQQMIDATVGFAVS